MYKSLQIWIINKCLFITPSITKYVRRIRRLVFDDIDALFHPLICKERKEFKLHYSL